MNKIQKTKYRADCLVVTNINYSEERYIDTNKKLELDVELMASRLLKVVDNYRPDKEPEKLQNLWNSIDTVNIKPYNVEEYNIINIQYFNQILYWCLCQKETDMDFQSIVLLLFNAHFKLFNKEYLEPFVIDIVYKNPDRNSSLKNRIIIKDGILTLLYIINEDNSYQYNYIIDENNTIILDNITLETHTNSKNNFHLIRLVNEPKISLPMDYDCTNHIEYMRDYNKNIFLYKLKIFDKFTDTSSSVINSIDIEVNFNIKEITLAKQHFKITLNRYNWIESTPNIMELILSGNYFEDCQTILRKRKLLGDKSKLIEQCENKALTNDSSENKYASIFMSNKYNSFSLELKIIEFINIFLSMKDSILENKEMDTCDSPIKTNW